MRQRHMWFLFSVLIVSTGTLWTGCMNAPSGNTPAASRRSVASERSPAEDVDAVFLSLICRDYESGGRLTAWAHTSQIVRESLRRWCGGVETFGAAVNPGRQRLVQVLRGIRDHSDADLIVVYIGARQTKGGDCLLIDGSRVGWGGVFADARLPSALADRTFFILDTCNAGAALEKYPQLSTYGTWFLASRKGELVYQRNLKARRSYDFRRRHPRAWREARSILGEASYWVSHTGLLWLVARAGREGWPVRDTDEFRDFLSACSRAGRFVTVHSRFRGSTIPKISK